ncbi:metal cation symporter ZIP14-like [Antedon mediterranea]|uniref:metal cation symporter ZIP14-like n=1 Tax=Antedon mediterranea TaxID=105859 RepID=UPI003AF4F677
MRFSYTLISVLFCVCCSKCGDPLLDTMTFIQDFESSQGGHLSKQQTNILLEILWERSGCIKSLNEKCLECLPVDTLFEIIGANSSVGLTESSFPKATVVLTYYLYNFAEICENKLAPHNYTWYLKELMTAGVNGDKTAEEDLLLTDNELSHILNKINKTYIALSKVKCFYTESLFKDANVDVNPGADKLQTESVCAYTISDLLQGDCIGENTYVQPNAFIGEIYRQYGKGDQLTHGGFEQIMTSLGLGSHSHTAAADEHGFSAPERMDECLTSHDLLNTFEIVDDVDKPSFQLICPSLIQQLLNSTCDHHHDEETSEGPDNLSVYGWGTLSVLIISLLSLVGAATIPMLNSSTYDKVLQVFIALAIGTMSGDAFLHLMPEALGLHSHEEGAEDTAQNVLWKNLTVVISLYVFFLFEKGSASLLGGGHSHSHRHGPSVSPPVNKEVQENGNCYETNKGFQEDVIDEKDDVTGKDIVSLSMNEGGTSEKKKIDDKNGGINSLNAMILIGDGIHNLMDGLAIGVAFTASITVGLSTCIAVVFHELPHELGDFAVLVNNGLSVKKALLCNFGTACMAFFGLYIGIIAGEGTAIHQWVFAVTAGMFIYVSLVDLMPELDHTKSDNPGQTFLLQNIGLVLGWSMMVLIAYFEGQLA